MSAAPSGPPSRGEWLFSVREGAERDLVEEILLADPRGSARVAGAGLVASHGAPSREGRIALTFARQGFPVSAVLEADSYAELADGVAGLLAPQLKHGATYALQVWVPDTEAGNRLSAAAHELEEAASARLDTTRPDATRRHGRDLGPEAATLAQVCLFEPLRAAIGTLSSNRALSLAPGGRLRVHVPGDRPSRSSRKLAEAFAWIGMGPEPGELCVDLGAAPGGWTFVLLERRAKVIAIDPGKLQPELLSRKGLTYIGGNAFDFVPEEPVDWLFCDMAFRPVEVARLLARWARERLATMLVANFKLPMKRKAETVREIVAMLDSGGWKGIRARQLYHDREEITVVARVG